MAQNRKKNIMFPLPVDSRVNLLVKDGKIVKGNTNVDINMPVYIFTDEDQFNRECSGEYFQIKVVRVLGE